MWPFPDLARTLVGKPETMGVETDWFTIKILTKLLWLLVNANLFSGGEQVFSFRNKLQ